MLLVLAAAVMRAGSELPQFRAHVIASDLKGGYQVVPYDLNRDGRMDLIALASGMPDLVWFENPGAGGGEWKRHLIGGPFPRMINLAAADTNGDGVPEIVLAHGFANIAAKSTGNVVLLESQGSLDKGWKAREIDQLTTSHRIRVARVDGQLVFINATLTGASAEPPEYRGRTPVVMYRPGVWKRELISDQDEGVLHGVWIGRWGKEKTDSIITASFSGLHRYVRNKGQWTRVELSKGSGDAWPKSGSSDVDVTKRWMAAIEPWHGNFVAIYDARGGNRKVIDDSLVDGHTIIAADLDGDGREEIVAGYRGGDRGVNLYRESNGVWKKLALDRGTMSAEACIALDLNGDRRTDIACIGSATTNLKWYENLGAGGR